MGTLGIEATMETAARQRAVPRLQLLRYGDVTLGFMWMWNARYFVDDKKWKTMDDQLLRFGKIYHR
jgi:hypothetical protein